MATNFPTSLDTFTNPTSGNTLDSPSHSGQHSDINDAVEAIETKVGIGASPAGSATAGHALVASTGGTTSWTTIGTAGISSGTATNGQVLTADGSGGVSFTTSSSSKVVQIQNATYSTQTNSTSATLADTGLTVSITPTSASNKILVFVYQTGIRTSASGTTANYALLRGATNISTIEVSAPDGGGIATGATGITYLDSPATTSATTYKTQFARRVGAGTVACQYDGSVSTITVMEVTP